eukprot:CAMPEP_0197315752 /NCGR_PEP_ID=MMETSP0891-20130614/39561_1 /TAXON_ID=44058 ORGANISM="Aureoumbra lagunensis, Strain CCMP1510" /NCGR_SAMPLE_ID=MMETSP0891 /ASSEMBLY_ACC=CAM_ASM_000534 /LENGTH=646 /DNA_ID=CAMNT_0042804887 /DNA_START=255 /DNA_END=2195 /DNA_ORIENTATION=-
MKKEKSRSSGLITHHPEKGKESEPFGKPGTSGGIASGSSTPLSTGESFHPHVTGPAAEAINRSNCVPTDHRPRRTPWIVRAMGKHKKYIKKPQRRLKSPKGKVIDGRDEQYILTYAMRLGITRSIDYAQKALPDSFEKAVHQRLVTKFPPGGSSCTPRHDLRHTFKVIDYAPCLFSKIRRLTGVSDETYRQSLCDSRLGFIKFIANGRSGQFFFYSNDHVFMIKTLRPDEKKFLIRLLPDYYAHLLAHSNEQGDGDSENGEADNGTQNDIDRFILKSNQEQGERIITSMSDPGTMHNKEEQRHRRPSSNPRRRLSRQISASLAANPALQQLLPINNDEMIPGDPMISSHLDPMSESVSTGTGQQQKTQRSKLNHLESSQEEEDLRVPNANDSLLTRFYGLHCIKLRHLKRKVYFVVMASIFGGIPYEQMSYQYDLKGSSYHREAKEGDIVLKDNDARKSGLKIIVGKERAKALLSAAASDAEFLARNGVMDYSLLIGVYHLPVNVPTIDDNDHQNDQRISGENAAAIFGALDGTRRLASNNNKVVDDDGLPTTRANTPTGSTATEDRTLEGPNRSLSTSSVEDQQQTVACYFMGIIDILQVYTFRKHLETDINIMNKGPRKYRECSCVPPTQYRDRFISFLESIIV